jgi:hypothetical protein
MNVYFKKSQIYLYIDVSTAALINANEALTHTQDTRYNTDSTDT